MDIVERCLDSASLSHVFGPVCVTRGDWKRPYVITIFWLHAGMCLFWDAMCEDCFVPSHFVKSIAHPGSVETSCAIFPVSIKLLSKVSKALSVLTGYCRETMWLHQWT